LCDFSGCHDGARKSRNNGCCDCMFEVLKLRYAVAGAHAMCALREESAFRHLFEMLIVVDMLALNVGIAVRFQDFLLFRLWNSICNALGAKVAGRARRG
jgi:hypothetical protein